MHQWFSPQHVLMILKRSEYFYYVTLNIIIVALIVWLNYNYKDHSIIYCGNFGKNFITNM